LHDINPDWQVSDKGFQRIFAAIQVNKQAKDAKEYKGRVKADATTKKEFTKYNNTLLESRRNSSRKRIAILTKMAREEMKDFPMNVGEAAYEAFEKVPLLQQKAYKQKMFKDRVEELKQNDELLQSDYASIEEIKRKKFVPTAGPRPKRPQKERPAGGGSIVVTGDPVGEGDAKKGTIMTTKGAYGNAKQYKFEPGEDGNFKSFRHERDPQTGGGFWREGNPISAGEAYKISGGKAGKKDAVYRDTAEDMSGEDYRIGEEARRTLDDRQQGEPQPLRGDPMGRWTDDEPVPQPIGMRPSSISNRSAIGDEMFQPERNPNWSRNESPIPNRAEIGDEMFQSPLAPDGGYFSGLEEEEDWEIEDALRRYGREGVEKLSRALAPEGYGEEYGYDEDYSDEYDYYAPPY